jgi:hypothetical protein
MHYGHLTVYSLCRARKQRDSVVFKCINISDINIENILVYVSSTTPTVQTRVQCNENTSRSYENLSVSKFVKTAINTAITVKLLKSKVTLLNTCEKLKMSHEHNLPFEITQMSMRLVNCYCEHVTIRLKCGSECGTERIHGTDMEIKCGTERSFSPLFLRFCVFDLCSFCNGIQRRSAYYS